MLVRLVGVSGIGKGKGMIRSSELIKLQFTILLGRPSRQAARHKQQSIRTRNPDNDENPAGALFLTWTPCQVWYQLCWHHIHAVLDCPWPYLAWQTVLLCNFGTKWAAMARSSMEPRPETHLVLKSDRSGLANGLSTLSTLSTSKVAHVKWYHDDL